MPGELQMGPKVHLPLDAITQTFGLLGRKGAGKSYGAGKLVEELLDAGGQTVILDPIGIYYGLRLDAKGKPGGGFSIPVLGGEHGDIPLEPGAGALLADLIVDRGLSAVVDVSGFRKKERKAFVADFAEQLFHRKKTRRTAMHLVLEEAQVFAPQRPGNGEERMLGAVEDIVRLGRNYGIGATLISQRPQSVNKEVLNQVECLFVFQLAGRHERKAVGEWIVHQGLDIGEMVESLPSLPVGTCYLWSPQWLGRLERVKIGKKRTLDTSSTPKIGAKVPKPRELAPVELDELKASMAELVEQAQANDPKALKKRIRELEAELQKARADRPAPERVEVPVLTDEGREALEDVRHTLSDAQAGVRHVSELLENLTATVHEATAGRPTPPRERTPAPREHRRPQPRPRPRPREQQSAAGNGEIRLNRGAREMLRALAQFPEEGLTRAQVATLAGMSPRSGTFRNYLGDLRKSGFATDDGDRMFVTDEGLAYLGDDVPSAATSTDELVRLWGSKLNRGARAMLDVLVDHYPATLTRDALAQLVGMSPGSGTYRNYLGDLRRNGLLEEPSRGEVRASETLFIGEGGG